MTGLSLPWKMTPEQWKSLTDTVNSGWENSCLCLEDGIKPATANLINLQSIYNDCLEGEYILNNKQVEYVCSDCGVQITRHAKTGKCRSCSRNGISLSQAHKDAISKGNLGLTKSDEHRKKLSSSRKGRFIGADNPMYGRNHTEESKRKISETKMSKPDAGKKKVKQISSYIDYDRESQKEVVWRQKIDQNGTVQGTGCFLIRKPGTGSIENRRRWSIECNARRRSLGHHKISLNHEWCEWHHVTREHIVAMPAHIHSKIWHQLGQNNLEGVLG